MPPGPYRAGAVSLHPHQQQFTPGPVTSALEDALTRRQDFKLDLVTPVVRPQQENKQVGSDAIADELPRLQVGYRTLCYTLIPHVRPWRCNDEMRTRAQRIGQGFR